VSLTLKELRAGFDTWRDFGWPDDLHNAFYLDELPRVQPQDGVFDDGWWGEMWPLLWDWKAARAGGGRLVMGNQAHMQFGRLHEFWMSLGSRRSALDLSQVKWDRVEQLPAIAAEIKRLKHPSPVFPSKFSHFLIPKVFPVIDRAAMGLPYRDYSRYFAAAQSEWASTDERTRTDLRTALRERVGAELCEDYPVTCKLVEISMMGRHRLAATSAWSGRRKR
jgi:hypothetical protein